MSVEQQATRVASGAKSALKALIQKLGGTVPDSTKIDGYADIVDAMTLAAMKPSSHASTHKTGGSDAIAPADIGAAASSHTHAKADITDFPASMTPTTHKATHKTGGSDAIAPADIGAAAASHTHTKSQITDFPSSMTPTAHKSTHATGGTDAIAPADIGAAAASHTHAASAITSGQLPIARGGTGASTAAAALAALQAQKELAGVTVTLSASGWTDKTQTVSVTGVTASNVVFVGAGENKDNQTAYAKAGITCTGQAAGTLTFTCDTVPTADITANVVPC
nr:MAG TPA: hypothetical protein [Bacteriophage sp.]